MSTNPFTFGNPIREPSRFYDRKQEIRQIVNRLLSSAHESTSVVGERRIGKTSLLIYLSSPEVASSLGLAPDKYCLVYLDFQGLTDITPQRFWRRVLSKMARANCNQELAGKFQKLAKQNEFDLFDLEDLFEAIANHGRQVVLLLDEFEYVTQNPNFGSDFFGGLRALAIHHPLSLIPATQRELVELCHSEAIKGSPFFNIFASVVLRPFTRQEAEELINGYTSGASIVLAPAEQEWVLKLGGRHPFLIQIAGYYLTEGKLQGLAPDKLQEFVTTNFAQQTDAHYSYQWSHCSESEKITLLTIMTLSHQKESKNTIPNLENITRAYSRAQQDLMSLKKRGWVDEGDGVYSLFSPTLEDWITQEITTPAGADEPAATVEAWLAKGGRENLKPIKSLLQRFKKKYWPIVSELVKEASIKAAVEVLFKIQGQ